MSDTETAVPPYSAKAPQELHSEPITPVPVAAPAPAAMDTEKSMHVGATMPQPSPQVAPAAPVAAAAAPVGNAQGFQTAMPLQALNMGPAPIDCPSCGQRALTRVEYHSGNTTVAWAAVLCCVFCLGCIPFLMTSLKDVVHYCTHCGTRIATWHRSGRLDQHVHR